MDEHDVLAERFEAHRARLRDVAYQTLGSSSEAAARNGDFDALLEALDPDVVVRSNGAEAVRGAVAVAGRAFPFTRIAQLTLPALITEPPASSRPRTETDHTRGVHDHRREDRCDRPYRRPPPRC